jgi:hypothetical protein
MTGAMREGNAPRLPAVPGKSGRKLAYSGDPVADRDAHARLVAAYDVGSHIDEATADRATLIVGADNWPWPIPIVRRDTQWYFDSVSGEQRIVDRRIGRNELNLIEVCRAYVEAQREYRAKIRTNDALLQYATRFESTPGTRDGLYWSAIEPDM